MTIAPFEIHVPDAVLEDVRDRLRATRWPIDVANDDWSYGTNVAYLVELAGYWLDRYDWREHEAAMNRLPNYITEIEGVPIHFVHVKGNGPDPQPLICTHGWPWTHWDLRKVIGPLSDPAAYGGDPADAFDVVVPSLPGFGFSSPLTTTGVTWYRTADLWNTLMQSLGYERYFAQGGDWGALVATQLGHKYAEQVRGVHLSMVIPPDFMAAGLPTEDEYPDDEKWRFHHTVERMAAARSHLTTNSSDPSSVAVALNSNPAGLAAYIVGRRRAWSDSRGDLESVFSKDDLITTVMIYWVTETINSSMRFYWESAHHPWTPEYDDKPIVRAPTAVDLWPQELVLMPTPMMEENYNLERVTQMKAGGHFAPMERPVELVDDVRAFVRALR